MATPIEKLDVLFDGEDWSYYYFQYTRTPLPGARYSNFVNEVQSNSLELSPIQPQSIQNVQGSLLSLGKSNEFIINVITLFDELYNLSPGQTGRPDAILGNRQSQSMNIRGQFKMSDSSGNFIDYVRGDVVYYEGKTYIASRNVSGWVPESKHPDNGWRPIDLPDETIDGSEF